MEQTKYDVFISYSRKDYVDETENVIPNNEVSKIMKALTDAGITYWIDKEGIYSGDKFTEELPKIIKSAPIFVYLSTANANKSKYTSKEIAIADEYGKYIIPVRIDMTPYSDKVIFRIADVSFIKYEVNPKKGREELVKSIRVFLKKQKDNELQKIEDERLREEELERQRKQLEEEKKRQEQITKIESEIAAFEVQKIEYEKVVLQKEQELKLAQVDLKACEVKIQKLQTKLDEIRKQRKENATVKTKSIAKKRAEKDRYTRDSDGVFSITRHDITHAKQLSSTDFSKLINQCKKNKSHIWESDLTKKSIRIPDFIRIVKNEYGITISEELIENCETIGQLKIMVMQLSKGH